MANNRMAIKCLECGEELILASYSPGPFYSWVLYDGRAEKLQVFLEAHTHDFDDSIGPTHFSLTYEVGYAHSAAEIDEHNKKAGYEDTSIFGKEDA